MKLSYIPTSAEMCIHVWYYIAKASVKLSCISTGAEIEKANSYGDTGRVCIPGASINELYLLYPTFCEEILKVTTQEKNMGR